MMKKYLGLISLVTVLVFLLGPILPVLASYSYYIPIRVYNNSTEDYSNLVVLVDINSAQLVSWGYIDADGLNTDVFEGVNDRIYMVADGKLAIFVSSILAGQTRTYNYRLGDTTGQAGFPVMVGVGGNVTISDDSDLELDDTFEIEQKGWINTSVGSDKNSIYKQEAFKTYISAEGKITSEIFGGAIGPFYPDGDPEDTSVDGVVTSQHASGLGVNWTTLLDTVGPFTEASDTAGVMSTFSILGDSTENKWRNFPRSILLFDTSVIPDAVNITSARLVLTGNDKTDGVCSSQLALNVYSSNPVSDTALNITDYLTLGTTAYSDTSIGYAGWEIWETPDWDGENEWIFNATGIAAIVKDGITKLGIRCAYWDVAENVPAWGSGLGYYVNVSSKTADSSVAPMLVVTWDDPPLPTVSVTATGVTSGERIVKTTADGTNFKIYIAGDEKASAALNGTGVAQNSNNWVLMQNNVMPYMEYITIEVGDTEVLRYQPNTMILGTELVDRQGGDEDGTIYWGTNPDGIEVEVGGIIPLSTYTAPEGGEEGDIPIVLPEPTGLELFEDPGVDVTGLPAYELVNRFSDSVGWSVQIGYSIIILIIAIAFGIGAMIAIGSIWGFAIGFGITATAGAGTGVLPYWIAIIVVFFVFFGAYSWSRT